MIMQNIRFGFRLATIIELLIGYALICDVINFIRKLFSCAFQEACHLDLLKENSDSVGELFLKTERPLI